MYNSTLDTERKIQTYYKQNKMTSKYKSKACPIDFPEKLKKYWTNNLEYSSTPIQCGWMHYYQVKKRNYK